MDLYAKLAGTIEDLAATFTARMDTYEKDLKSVSSNEATHKTIASLSREFVEFKCLIWKTMSALKTQMELLIVGLDRHEMASRRQVLLLHGLPEQKDEDHISRAISTVVDRMKIPNISPSDIISCHRLGVNSGKPRPLLIRFANYNQRSEIWRSKTLLKGSGLVFSEFLTKPRHDVFLRARKHFSVKQCWTSKGKIVILLPDKSRWKIESAAELQQLITRFPAAASTNVSSDKTSRRQAK